MLIYEKENKLNINFDNEVSEQPDLQISKEDGKTSVTIDGQQNSQIPVPVLPDDVGKAIIVDENGGYTLKEASGGVFVVPFTVDDRDNVTTEISIADINTASYTMPVIAIAVKSGKAYQYYLGKNGDDAEFVGQFNQIIYVAETGGWTLTK